MAHEKVLTPHVKVLKRHELIIIVMRRRKHYFLDLILLELVLRVQSRKK